MELHKFKVGEHVTLKGNQFGIADGEGYQITRLLPVAQREPEYRIKRSADVHERVAAEHMLRSIDTNR